MGRGLTRDRLPDHARRQPSDAGLSRVFVAGGITLLAVVVVAVALVMSLGRGGSGGGQTGPTVIGGTPPPSPSTQSEFIKLPENFTVFVNNENHFSLAYPNTWPAMTALAATATSNSNTSYTAGTTPLRHVALGTSELNGRLTASVIDITKGGVVTHANGATVATTKVGNDYTWKVIALGAADPTYKIGDSYPINASNFLPTVAAYNFSEAEKNQLRGRWAIISGSSIVLVELPVLSRADGGIPAADDGDKYTDISAYIAQTLRPTM